jgi:hypothetical protein
VSLKPGVSDEREKMINAEISAEILKARFQGRSIEELKPLYIKRNAFNISLDSTIHRIFQIPFILDDIAAARISLVNINPLIFGDPRENPLLDKIFIDETGDSLTLNEIMKHYYGLSWTLEEREDPYWWPIYTHGNLGLRITTTAKKLMTEITNLENPFFMLQYRIGKVAYHHEQEIDQWINEAHYSDFLDSLGQHTALSLMALRTDHSDEKEARLLYTHMPNALDNTFTRTKVLLEGDICRHPFQWNSVISGIVLDPRLTGKDYRYYADQLRELGITCNIRESSMR